MESAGWNMIWRTGLFLLLCANIASCDKITELSDLLGSYLPPANSFGSEAPKDIFGGLGFELPGSLPSEESSSTFDDNSSNEPNLTPSFIPFNPVGSTSQPLAHSSEGSESNSSFDEEDDGYVSSNQGFLAPSVKQKEVQPAPPPICVLPDHPAARRKPHHPRNEVITGIRDESDEEYTVNRPLFPSQKPSPISPHTFDHDDESKRQYKPDDDLKTPFTSTVRATVGQPFRTPVPGQRYPDDSIEDQEPITKTVIINKENGKGISKSDSTVKPFFPQPVTSQRPVSENRFTKQNDIDKPDYSTVKLRPIPAKPSRVNNNRPVLDISSEEIDRNNIETSIFLKMPSEIPVKSTTGTPSNKFNIDFSPDKLPAGVDTFKTPKRPLSRPSTQPPRRVQNTFSSNRKTSVSNIPGQYTTTSTLKNFVEPGSKPSTIPVSISGGVDRVKVSREQEKSPEPKKSQPSYSSTPFNIPTSSPSTKKSSSRFTFPNNFSNTPSISRTTTSPKIKVQNTFNQQFSTKSFPTKVNEFVFGAKLTTPRPTKNRGEQTKVFRPSFSTVQPAAPFTFKNLPVKTRPTKTKQTTGLREGSQTPIGPKTEGPIVPLIKQSPSPKQPTQNIVVKRPFTPAQKPGASVILSTDSENESDRTKSNVFRPSLATEKPFRPTVSINNRVTKTLGTPIERLQAKLDQAREKKEKIRRGSILLSEPQQPDGGKSTDDTETAKSKMMNMMPYEFKWNVDDGDTGNNFGQTAVSDGMVEKGKYFVLLPDGRKQVVTYFADWETGYHVDITYE